MNAIDNRLDARATTREKAARALATMPDDTAMLRAAVELTRDLGTARPGIYWPDCLVSAALGYGALATAIVARQPWLVVLAGLVAALALYRATLFIHELSHIRQGALPGFRLVWNLTRRHSPAHAFLPL